MSHMIKKIAGLLAVALSISSGTSQAQSDRPGIEVDLFDARQRYTGTGYVKKESDGVLLLVDSTEVVLDTLISLGKTGNLYQGTHYSGVVRLSDSSAQTRPGGSLYAQFVPTTEAERLEVLGNGAYLRGAYFEALGFYSSALELDTDNPWLLSRRSYVLEALGKHEEAKVDARSSLSQFAQLGERSAILRSRARLESLKHR
ncbi:hypothetical protein [Gloeobacter morelensis]|uniref:hypothetical protein n=1 Tax=Gloeobacter morelensis TaxID=2907343 RepID=UPI001E322799|nr:hypothetical protein [Gloeobacter morelensis]UFP97246.1 hypothetical protein ISF26_24295 [Gloeobacter morelensis MG652769]